MRGRPAIKRKFAYIGAGWVAGLLIFLALGKIGLLVTAAAVLVSVVHARSTADRPQKEYIARQIMLTSLSALAGALFFLCYFQTSYYPVRALSGRRVTVEGTVTDRKLTSRGNIMLTISGRINGKNARVVIFTEDDLPCGERVTSEFEARIPESGYSFDAEDYYRSLGIYLTGNGSVKSKGSRNILLYRIKRLRERALAGIYESCGEKEGAFIASMLCSDKSRLDDDTRRAVYRSGLGHIFAVSGTHIVMLTALLAPILKRLIVSTRLRNAVLGTVVILFAVFAGGTVPVMRACVMMLVSLSAAFFLRQADSANSLGLAAVILTLAEPFAVTSVSFALSFTAAAAFGILSPEMTRERTDIPLMKLIVSCLFVIVLTMPICAASFDEISLASAATNVFLMPLCAGCLYLAMIFAVSGGTLTPLMLLADRLAGLIIRLCELISASEYSYVGTEKARLLTVWGIAGSALFAVCALTKKRRKTDLLICFSAYLLICVLAANPK